jgi:hypothetical protein
VTTDFWFVSGDVLAAVAIAALAVTATVVAMAWVSRR